MRLLCLLPAFSVLAACYGDETVRAYGAADKLWRVTELSGAPFAADATLAFPEPGKIAGDGPCNRYSASMTVPYPWFDAGPISATKSTCPDLAAENAYFNALKATTLSEVLGDTMILSDEIGILMVLKSGA